MLLPFNIVLLLGLLKPRVAEELIPIPAGELMLLG